MTRSRGSNHYASKLNESQVKDIRIRLANNEKQTAIAYDYNVDPTTITSIKKGKIWKHTFKPDFVLVDMHVKCCLCGK